MARMVKKTVVKRRVAPFYAAMITWCLCALIFPLYKIVWIVVTAVLSALVFVLADRKKKEVEIEVPEEPVATGNPDADSAISEGRLYVDLMKRANDDISSPKVSEKIDRLCVISEKIFSHIAECPGKIGQIRKFMNYYLPTTTKILNAYAVLEKQETTVGNNVTGTMKSIESILDTIVDAFDKQLDNLFKEEALDITSDVAVLEAMMGGKDININTDNK